MSSRRLGNYQITDYIGSGGFGSVFQAEDVTTPGRVEFISGEVLSQESHRNGPLAPSRAASILAEVLEALSYAHRNGIIHPDLKPDNIILIDDGALKIARTVYCDRRDYRRHRQQRVEREKTGSGERGCDSVTGARRNRIFRASRP
ncbi:MAG TPA: hypothetical protein VF747_04095 [Blastocatellia bacterium]|jgi:serine/threonine protein kinase